ncbi:MAG TPA: hypothetical protein VF455_10520 [Chryseobacterium sp.]
MGGEIISERGERAAMGGYLPQFDEFAWFAKMDSNKSCSSQTP